MNSRSIGICIEGCYEDYAKQTEKEVPKAQLDTLVELTKYLMQTYNIASTNVKRHCDFASYKKCPGNYFTWDGFKSRLVVVEQPKEKTWQEQGLETLVAKGIISEPTHWKSKWEEPATVKDMIGILAKIVR
ncbi:MAG: hypothetical protein A2Y24_01410 [Clostridiales bacterium GWE2_32_10]|nr:MAG: hypothetical protein A2Y24_01410 [Clostridiales bacterium GWE2_32_10]